MAASDFVSNLWTILLFTFELFGKTCILAQDTWVSFHSVMLLRSALTVDLRLFKFVVLRVVFHFLPSGIVAYKFGGFLQSECCSS